MGAAKQRSMTRCDPKRRSRRPITNATAIEPEPYRAVTRPSVAWDRLISAAIAGSSCATGATSALSSAMRPNACHNGGVRRTYSVVRRSETVVAGGEVRSATRARKTTQRNGA